RFPSLYPAITEPDFFSGVDLVIPTSGSSAGTPHLVGLSIDALIASARATHEALSGPGKWILALPAHHIAGAMVLLRAAVAETNPQIVDTSAGFDPRALLPAIAGATAEDGVPGYLSLVPTQLASCLADDQVIEALSGLSAILVGGAHTRSDLLDVARGRGLNIVTTYGMTETCGGCIYNGVPQPGVEVRTVEHDSQARIALSGPMLMTRYVDGDSPLFVEGGTTWMLTGDIGVITSESTVKIQGRADDVIVSGGLSVAPAPVLEAVLSCDEVADAWVTSTPDDKWGELITTLVVPKNPISSADEVDQFARHLRSDVGEVLGRVYAPRRVVVTGVLPYLSEMKIDRMAATKLLKDAEDTVFDWRR
ncbi:MAG: AMP-binding protein, partial [Actinomycetaceae bacterium UMB1218B]|nr:AMP-binding protein [Actinomycetaceae bacterium UMB1218B]